MTKCGTVDCRVKEDSRVTYSLRDAWIRYQTEGAPKHDNKSGKTTYDFIKEVYDEKVEDMKRTKV
jgi:hypothetical protein